MGVSVDASVRRTAIFVGTILSIAGCAGIWHAAHASLAQALYFRAKYGRDSSNAGKTLELCSTAHSLYPYNYYCCLLAGESAWDKKHNAALADDRRLYASSAERWCEIGLKLNPFQTSLRHLKVRILEERSVSEAIAYWEQNIDWQFWVPYNHFVMLELYAKAGYFEKALERMKWLRGTDYEKDGMAFLRATWEKDASFP